MRFSPNAAATLAPTGLRNFPRQSFSWLRWRLPLAVLYFSKQLLHMQLQCCQISGEPRSRATGGTNSEDRFLGHSEWMVYKLQGEGPALAADGIGPGECRAPFKALPVSSTVLSPACRLLGQNVSSPAPSTRQPSACPRNSGSYPEASARWRARPGHPSFPAIARCPD